MNDALLFAWAWILAGLLSGVALGTGFARPEWLGGYGSWTRRLLRLGHVSFVATGLLVLAAAATATVIPGAGGPWVLRLLIAGAVAMPVCCALAAFVPRLRLLFALPVAALTGGSGILVVHLAGLAGATA